MRKQLIIIGIITLLLTIGLSGCNQLDPNANSGNIIIVSHNTRTDYGYYPSGNVMGIGDYREVYGTVKNIADKNVDYAEVTVKFYDKDNELLITKKTQLEYIAKGETKDFSVCYISSEKYYDQYDHYTVSVWSKN